MTTPHDPGEHSSGVHHVGDDVETMITPVVASLGLDSSAAPTIGGPLLSLDLGTSNTGDDAPDASNAPGHLRAGLRDAGPVAVAGLVVNGVSALVVVVIARLVSSRSYGEIAQLLGVFFILSMPGSAVLVGVVRQIAALRTAGHADRVALFVHRIRRIVGAAVLVETVLVVLARNQIASALTLSSSSGVVAILVAAGVWIFLSVDRGVLQAHRLYRPLAANLLVEGGVRTAVVLVLVGAHLGVAGYMLGVLASELAATAHAHWLARGALEAPVDAPRDALAPDAPDGRAGQLWGDVGAAFVGLALLGFLQNVDVILIGRTNHAAVGSYAAISVASKAMVFGALALGAYLLPEAAIRWHEGGHAIRQFAVTLIFLAVPAALLLIISIAVPRWFLTLVFGARLSGAAPAFALLVGAMICLSVTVLLTNYLFGTGSRWMVLLLAAGALGAWVSIDAARGDVVGTARADLLVQAALVVAMGAAFVVVHHRRRVRAT